MRSGCNGFYWNSYNIASNSRIDVTGEPLANKERRVPVVRFVVQGVGSQRPCGGGLSVDQPLGSAVVICTATGYWPMCADWTMWRTGWCGSANCTITPVSWYFEAISSVLPRTEVGSPRSN
ncbi:hypothetical protein PDIG_27010 [Penicillium digitatum PHI26]|uniref:Uncharacterized protein n=2 Tax=Penicillium digitatum TaxID=36651 RepID=K9GKL2_PEND2|nr:hypothetical protein PDIP_61450 [Penicillium digitatum Pd1]EKV10007.1 hypothetical protein PDIP_61450 [Penicillium digitatum Pd1]EKV15263.1 hypothetical protein PDIG_27010 [Penicillium digitatum PHI26]